MFTRVCAILTIGAGVIFAANGETKKWVGGDGLWKDAAMWSPSGVPASTDDVIIENGKVEYVPGGVDLAIDAGATLTIGNGGTFVQSTGVSWIQLKGAIVVKSGGTFDMGSCYRVNADTTTASITVEKGGTFIKRNAGKEQTGTLPIVILGEGTNYWSGAKICTWTGNAGDGKWLTAENWDGGEVPATIDDVVIPEGETVEYEPGGDLTIWGSLTLGKGAKWVQINNGNWIQLYGQVVVGEGAQFDVGTAAMKVVMNMHDGCSVHVCEGGWMNVQPLWGTGSWGTTQRVFVDGTIEWCGASELTQADFTKLSQTIFTYSETGRLVNLLGVRFAGTTEMDFAGTIELAGFTAQSTGASGARENNELVMKRGKYIVRADAGHNPRGIVAWAPNDTDTCKTWVNFSDRSKAEVVFTHTDITNNADVIADPYNVYTQIKDCISSNDKVYNILYCRGEQILDFESFKKAFTVWQDAEGVHMKLKNPTGLVIRVQ